jgi:hypothetical protein
MSAPAFDFVGDIGATNARFSAAQADGTIGVARVFCNQRFCLHR